IDSGGIRRFVVILVYNKLHTDAHTRLVQPTKTSEKMSGTLSLRFQRFVLSQPDVLRQIAVLQFCFFRTTFPGCTSVYID
ncbi:hypothetical protein QDZ90_004007, partial [Pluralibacter gergoviae]